MDQEKQGFETIKASLLVFYIMVTMRTRGFATMAHEEAEKVMATVILEEAEAFIGTLETLGYTFTRKNKIEIPDAFKNM